MSKYRLNPPQQIGPDRRARAAVSLPVAVPSTPDLSAALKEEINNPMRRMGMVLSLVFIFLRFSQLHELITYMFGFNTYILYFCGPPAIALAIFSGGLRRVFSSRIAWMWAGFVLWMLLSTPFSFWRGESIALFGKYMRTEFPCLLLIAGLCVTWQDIRKFLIAIGAAAVCNVIVAKNFLDESGGRIYLEFGTIANANDFAAHLILVMPFLLLGVIWPKQNNLVRATLAVLICYGLYMVLGTGSRGALVALLVVSCFAFLRGTNMFRIVALLIVPLAAIAMFTFLQDRTRERLLSLFSSVPETTSEAVESRAKRMYLLTQSIRLTIEHPILGVGVGQFMNYEGDEARRQGIRGAWQASHNSYTQVSSELGLPGLFFFLGAILSTYVVAARTHKQAKQRPEWKAMEYAAFCIILSLLGFCVGIFFLSLAYGLYLPAMSGLVISLASVMRNQALLAAPPSSAVLPWARRASTPPFMNRPKTIGPAGLS